MSRLGFYGHGEGGRRKRSNRRTMRGGQCGNHGCFPPVAGGRRKRTNRRGNRRGNRRTMRGGQVTSISQFSDGGRRRRTMRGGQDTMFNHPVRTMGGGQCGTYRCVTVD